MAQVEIKVNDRAYRVTCENGQEERLQELARYFDRYVSEIAGDLGQIGDARLMLLGALTICDELFEARARISESRENGAALDPQTLAGANRVMEAAAKRVAALSERLAEAH